MKTLFLLLSVALALAECQQGNLHKRDKRELLVRSKRRWVLSTIEVKEEDPGPFPKEISQMFNDRTDDQKQNHKFKIRGVGVDIDPKGLFSIDEKNGSVWVHGSIDREKYQDLFHIKFDIFSEDTGQPIDKELSFDVEIEDINDNAPEFLQFPRIPVKVEENSEDLYLNATLIISDRDKADTPNSKIIVKVLDQMPAEPKFGIARIGPAQFHLTFQGCFNYDKDKLYTVTVQAADEGSPALTSTAVLTVEVEDTNTHQPKFQNKMYDTEVSESVIKKDILRVAVVDEDNEFTPGWKAKYTIIKGDHNDHFSIETDPKTNEGILNVVKPKNFDITTTITLEIEVENEQDIFACKDKTTGKAVLPPKDTAIIKVLVLDENDPPVFQKSINKLFKKEEEEPGKLLLSNKAHDPENDTIRYELIKDEANWTSVDSKTGDLKSVQKMDRESQYVDSKGVYKVLVAAIDDGRPPATSTSTVLFYLSDINDNTPQLVNSSLILCGNKANKVIVAAKDEDAHPYGGPFSFSLGGDAEDLKKQWKLDPPNGMETALISLKPLPYGNYTVPLEIQDQQNVIGKETVAVIVCDCGGTNTCLSKKAPSNSLGPAGIGMIFLAVLLGALLLLLLLFKCECGKEKPRPMSGDDGNQTLIKYNEEGGGAVCAALPSSPLPSPTVVTATDGLKLATRQISHPDSVRIKNTNTYNTTSVFMDEFSNNTANMHRRDTVRSLGAQNMYDTQRTARSSFRQGGSMRLMHSQSMRSSQHIQGFIDRKMFMMADNHVDHLMDQPHSYTYEGQGSRCQSLDELSLSNVGDDLHFLDNLDPKFKTLGKICHQAAKERKVQI